MNPKAFLVLSALASLAGAQAQAQPRSIYNQGDCLRNNAGSLICMNQSVASRSSSNRGVVQSLYTDGTVIVRMTEGFYSNTNQSFQVDQLTGRIDHLGPIYSGSEVKSRSSDNRGSVEELFDNGLVKVRMTEGYYSNTIQNFQAHELAARVRCVGQACDGYEIMSRSTGNIGVVEAAFDDGKLKVRMKTGYYANTIQNFTESELTVRIGSAPQPYPQPYPQPLPPAPPIGHPFPGPGPGHGPGPQPIPGVGGAPMCNLYSCQTGMTCANGCPAGAVCNFVRADLPYYRVVSCRR